MDDWPSTYAETLWLQDKESRQVVMEQVLSKIIDRFLDIRYSVTLPATDKDDGILMYGKQFLSIGCLYLEFTDAIKEGDGERVLRCWRYFIIIFHNSQRNNYAKEAVLLLHQCLYTLSPRELEEVMYSRFINTSGVQGRNVCADLHMEHLNRELKKGISALGSGKTQDTIIRLGKALGTVSPILCQFDEIGGIKHHNTRHKLSSMKQHLIEVVNTISNYKVLTYKQGRRYSSFPAPKSLLHKKQENELVNWIKTHVPN